MTTLVSDSPLQHLNDDAKISPFNYGDLLWIGLIVVVATWAFLQSYQKWLEPIIDVGRDLYIPGELLEGKKLYRDILYIYPPLTPYLLSYITWIFGDGLSIYTVISVTVSAIVMGALYFTARLTIHPIAAGIASLLFVTLNFTGVSSWGWNYIFPYTYAATFGMALFLLYLASMIVYLFVKQRSCYYFLAFAFGLLAAWAKIEYTFAVVVTLIVISVVHKLPLRYLLYSLLIGSVSFVAVSFILRNTSAGHHWLWDNILPHFLLANPIASAFFAQILGVDELSERIMDIAFGVLFIAMSVGLLVGIDRIDRGFWVRTRSHRVAMAMVLLTVLIFLFWQLADARFFRAWSLLQILLIPVAISKERRSPLFVLLLFSLLGSFRIYFNLAPAWFGVTLIIPAYLLITYVLFRYLPERGVYSSQIALLWIPLFVLLMIRGQMEQARYYTLRSYPIDTIQGRFYDSLGSRAAIIQDFLRYLAKSHYSGLVVMPEGLTLNYLSRVKNPLSFNTFTPPETADPGIEQRIIEEMEKSKPELVAINNRNVMEFGYKGFGVDYDLRLIAYLQKHYFLLRTWDSPSFKLALLHRARE